MFDETKAQLDSMWSRWTQVKIGIATNDMGHIRLELKEVRRTCCWPAKSGSEGKWQALKAREEAPARSRRSNAAALAALQFGH